MSMRAVTGAVCGAETAKRAHCSIRAQRIECGRSGAEPWHAACIQRAVRFQDNEQRQEQFHE